uniref:Uncharacterized protein n=1 Tax=Anopheles minimus TaxID=112268 RepID=A0A182W9T3_9DIPT
MMTSRLRLLLSQQDQDACIVSLTPTQTRTSRAITVGPPTGMPVRVANFCFSESSNETSGCQTALSELDSFNLRTLLPCWAISSSSAFTSGESVPVAGGGVTFAGVCFEALFGLVEVFATGAAGALSDVRGWLSDCSCFLSPSSTSTSGCHTARSAPLDLILRTLAACSSTAFWASFSEVKVGGADAGFTGAGALPVCCCCWPPYFCFSSSIRASSIFANSTAGLPIR